jgi:microcystin-dependent protein
MEGYLGEVRMFGGNFNPRGWMFCQGQQLAISNYDALYALLGTTYGGDGQTTFNLPNLASRVALHPGQGPGLPVYTLGQVAGTENNTITPANIAGHSHTVTGTAGIMVSSEDGRLISPVNNYPAVNGDNIYSSTNNTTMVPATLNLQVPAAGNGGSSLSNLKPYLCVNFIICVEGIFPSRN